MRYRVIVLVFFFCQNLFGQSYWHSKEEFGKNSTLQGNVKWKTFKTANFEVNFYRGGEAAAKKAAVFAEKELDRISDLIGFTPYTLFKIYLFNSARDLYSNNVGFSSVLQSQNGYTNFERGTIQLPILKDEAKFQTHLSKYVSELCIFEMMYGNNIRTVFQNSLHLDIEPWFEAGAASFASHNLTEAENQKIKAILVSKGMRNINRLKGVEAELVGNAIWNYIKTMYGEDAISNVLNLTRIIRSESLSISNSLGIPFKQFAKNFEDFYLRGLLPKKETIEIPKPKERTPSFILRDGEIDTENYQIESGLVAEYKAKMPSLVDKSPIKPSEKMAQMKAATLDVTKIPPARFYENTFLINASKVELAIDPLRRVGLRGGVVMNDVLENYTIKFETFLTPSWRNSDVGASIMYNLGKIDYGLKYSRRSLEVDEVDRNTSFVLRPLGYNLGNTLANNLPTPINQRVLMNRFTVLLSYPFSRFMRVQIEPSVLNTRQIGLGIVNLTRDELKSMYAANKYEWVFDNSQPYFGQMQTGTKAKIRYEHYFDSKFRKSENFSKFKIDIRQYQPVGGMIFASALGYSRSMGDAAKRVVLGGVENSVNRVIEPLPNRSLAIPTDIRDLLFTDFGGPLRGFNAFKVIGTSHFLWNNELRIPVSRYLAVSGNSKFIKNLQLVPFADIGTAWYGKSGPFKKQNSLNTTEITQSGSAFTATVTDFKNPFFYGLGLGARTYVLGHILSLDYGLGIEDKTKLGPQLQISLNSEF